MSDLAAAIERSRKLAVWIADQVGDRDLSSETKARVAASLISLCMWHHSSISQLYALGRHASGLALIRSMIDCFARAMWAWQLATEERIAGFISGDDPPSTLNIMKNLELSGVFDVGDLAPHFVALWPVVCDFNHGGGRMVVRHLTSTDIGPDFDEEDLRQSLNIADFIVLGAACALADIMQDPALGEIFLARLL